jgi:diguanylate cyclase (GGDEF)-like protein
MKILVVEDSSSERLFLRRYLENQGHEVLTAEDGASGVAMYFEALPDLVLLDMDLPDMDGKAAVGCMRENDSIWIPVIFLSGKDGTKDIREALDAGGDDYLVKPFQPMILEAKLRSMQRIATMRRALVEANDKLRRQAEVDGLTQIANRFQLDRRLVAEFARCARSRKPLSVILFDIDHFKRFNDTYGHATGDECLKLVARTAQDEIRRPADLLARYGGEEFCVLLPETPLSGAMAIAEALRSRVERLALDTPKGSTTLTISIGVACAVPASEGTPAAWLTKADAALYEAKHAGRNAVRAAAAP